MTEHQLNILSKMGAKEWTSSELAEHFGVSDSSMRWELMKLRHDGWLTSKRIPGARLNAFGWKVINPIKRKAPPRVERKRRWSIIGHVENVGKVEHIIKAVTIEAAKERFSKAHKGAVVFMDGRLAG